LEDIDLYKKSGKAIPAAIFQKVKEIE